LVPVTPEVAAAAIAVRRLVLSDLHARPEPAAVRTLPNRPPELHVSEADGTTPGYTIRRSGDGHLLVEAGSAELDLTVRVWIHLLADALRADRPGGVSEIVEGVRSLLVAVDDAVLGLDQLGKHLAVLASGLADPATVTIPSREVHLPIAFDHPEAHEAMRRYTSSVRADAPWCPDNIEFIRRVNDLGDRADVFDIVEAATYLVIGLGDVYLGAPVAVPLDPRHRLVTTKYNPARTWTPQNAVGIGGIYLCVYGMEGPGGYQLVGRTVPIWRLPEQGAAQQDEQPWLLRQFDRIRFRPVSVDELAHERAEIKAGRADLVTTPASFCLSEVAQLEVEAADEIAAVRAQRRAAFDAERRRWVS
ncbi:MAG: Urea carboxylase, partial [Marmoricola sp.]|nr:Urea carboxylase [Marmoricola sp.]